jgi:hypothetical protein
MHPLTKLFLALADVFSAEKRDGGNHAAKALIEASRLIDSPKKLKSSFAKEVNASLMIREHPLNSLVLEASPFIKWGGSDLREGRIPEDLANQMPMCELVGPDGLYFNKTVRVGLWLQTKDVVYGPRKHAAEETFYIINGEAEWWTELKKTRLKGSGSYVFHSSNIQHKSITSDKHVFTAWRWSGDIGFDKYVLY